MLYFLIGMLAVRSSFALRLAREPEMLDTRHVMNLLPEEFDDIVNIHGHVNAALKLKKGDDIARSRDAIIAASKAVGFEGFPEDCPVVFDVGTNNGADSEFFLEQGYCVVSVDANPLMIAQAKKRLQRFGPKVHFVSMGLDETVGNMTFYVTKSSTTSSFDKDKALNHDPKPVKIEVPTIRCEALWALVNRAPHYVKIDVEERHFVCVEALGHLPREELPQYISWEIHEFARGLPFPQLDTQLIGKLAALNYLEMKIVSNIDHENAGAFSGGVMPEGTEDVETHSTDWVSTSTKLDQGIPCCRCRRGDWWDYYMKLSK